MRSVDVIVTGRVQGVGFRAYAKKNANMLGVRGYVENLEDGSVHAVLEGDDHQVDKMIEVIRSGPMLSQVREMKKKDLQPSGFKNFEVS